MFINEAEHLVGLSKKSIRYYEENGLLTPKRNKNNSYRIYTNKDINKLKEINGGGEEIIEALGIVKGQIVQSKNIGRDFMAGMKTIVGGEITSYTEMLAVARQMATKIMVDDAVSLGADAVINVKYGSSSVMNGVAEIIAYGTAVKLKK